MLTTKLTTKRIPAPANTAQELNFLQIILNLILLFVSVIDGILGIGSGNAG